MNAPDARLAVAVRAADLSDGGECARIAGFLREQPGASLFHDPRWSRAVERGCGQRAHYLLAERAGGLVGCLPLTEIRSRLFGSALVSVGFATGGGIVAASDAAAEALAEAAWALAGRLGCGSVELRGGPLPEPWSPRPGVYAGFGRDLPADEAALLVAIPRKQRAEVRRAFGFDLEATGGAGPAARADHFRVYSESVRNLGTPVYPARFFDAALDEFGGAAEVVLIRKDGRPLATMLTFFIGGLCQPYWGGGTAEAKKWRANDLVYYEVMRRGIGRGCTRVDFGRSKVGTGPWSRKRIWGFEEIPLVYGLRTRDGAAAREVNPLDPKYRLKVAAWQRLPLWLANRLGPPIARGLG